MEMLKRCFVHCESLYLYCELLSGRELLWDIDGESLFSTQLQRVGILSWQELQRSDSHPHQMILMNLLKALCYHCTHPLRHTQTVSMFSVCVAEDFQTFPQKKDYSSSTSK